MSTTPPTDPSLRRGVKTSEFLLSAVTVIVTILASLLVLVDAIAASVPPQYEALFASVSAIASALVVGLYTVGRQLAKGRVAQSIPAYLEALKQPEPVLNVASGGDVTVNTGTAEPATEVGTPTAVPEGEDEAGIDPDVDPSTLS